MPCRRLVGHAVTPAEAAGCGAATVVVCAVVWVAAERTVVVGAAASAQEPMPGRLPNLAKD